MWTQLTLLLLAVTASQVAACSFSSGNVTWDFSALTSNTSYVAQDATGYTYRFNPCGVVQDETVCDSQAGTACQYGPGSGAYLATVAKWPGGTFSLIDPTDDSQGVKLHFANGDGCTGAPRVTDFLFTCSSQLVGPLSVVSTVGSCSYQIIFPTSLACVPPPSPPCGLALGNSKYLNFSQLTSDVSYSVYSVPGDLSFLINVCAPVQDEIICLSKQGSVCAYTGSKPATADFAFNAGSWQSSGYNFSLVSPSDPSKGVKLSFTNGDPCLTASGVQPRTTDIFFICDKNPVGTLSAITPEHECYDAILFPTLLACVS